MFGQLACFCLAFHADFLLLVSAPGTCCQPPFGILRMVVVTGFCQKSFILGMLVLYLMSAGKGFGFIAANKQPIAKLQDPVSAVPRQLLLDSYVAKNYAHLSHM